MREHAQKDNNSDVSAFDNDTCPIRPIGPSNNIDDAKMRISCLQFAPQVGDVDKYLNRADSVLSKANLDDVDLLVLLELAFSGNSSLSDRDAGIAIINHLEGISGRVESVNKMRKEAANTSLHPDRPLSPKSRNYSRSRPSDNTDFQKDYMIYITTSFSLLKNKGRSPY